MAIEIKMNPSAVSKGSPKRTEAEQAWIEIYKKLEQSPEAIEFVPRLRQYSVYQRSMINETLAEISKRLESNEQVSVWSAGSGIDTISLYLKNKCADSLRLTLQDISQECVSFNKEMFSGLGLRADFVVGNLFDSNYREEFDIAINTGLLEHFETPDQSRLLRVFSDSLKPGGVYLTATPFAGARLYSYCKKRIEARGDWKVGPETPISTMVGLESADLVLTSEHQIAARDQLNFVMDAYPRLGKLLYPAIVGLGKLPDSAEPVLLRLIGGYCLLDKFVKREG
jgi:2-polyprenyl-3-methyl-5-hydroxy-6-metoxy-1,4-benzoquinol methylase